MVVCPDCGYENIEGVDECAGCLQSLTPLSKPRPESELGQWLLRDPIDSLEPKQPVAVAPDARVGDVLRLMVDRHIGCVLVVQDAQLLGIFSERDALMRLNTRSHELKDRPIAEFMTEAPGTLEMNDKLAFAVHKMALGGYRHVPILAGGRPIGVISIRDILRYASQILHAPTPSKN